jgi:hypothetical protein
VDLQESVQPKIGIKKKGPRTPIALPNRVLLREAQDKYGDGSIRDCSLDSDGARACSRIYGWAGVLVSMPANDWVIAHYSVDRLTMSRDDGWITFREESAAVGTGGELCTVGHARWLSAGEDGRSRQNSDAGDSSCNHSWAK